MASTPQPTPIPTPLFVSSVAQPRVAAKAPTLGVPWYLWTSVVALSSAWLGGAWDVAWHRSIGRDGFWTAPHLLIQLCAILAGIVGLALVYRATWGRTTADEQLRQESVSLLGLRAPLGVFMAGWGGVAMLSSAPFDNWWHNAYGLDVKIISPPHALLVLGIRAISIGFLFLILAEINRASKSQVTDQRRLNTLRALYLYMGGLVVLGQMFFLIEVTWDVYLHSAAPYIGMGIGVPVVFAAFAETSRARWTATILAGVYTVLTMLEILIFPLFPAHPKLGPVYFPVTHLVPTKFPLLILAPAVAFDLLWQRAQAWKPWKTALIFGVLFIAVLLAAEWPFASFLMTKASANRFFGNIYFDYNSMPNQVDRMRLFWKPQHGLALLRGLSIAAVCAAISTWLGLLFGRWAKQVQR